MERLKKRKAESESSKLFRLISENPGVNVQEISDRLGWTRAKANRMLGVLERKGWTIRRVYPAAQPKVIVKPSETVQHLSSQFGKLAAWKARLEAREKELFDKCVSMQMQGDQEEAAMYANQCAEIRKIVRLVVDTEQILSRLSSPGG